MNKEFLDLLYRMKHESMDRIEKASEDNNNLRSACEACESYDRGPNVRVEAALVEFDRINEIISEYIKL